jgi:hypothetical protein
MTITTRRLAHRCRERLAMSAAPLTHPAEAAVEEAPTTVEVTEVGADAQLDKVDAAK